MIRKSVFNCEFDGDVNIGDSKDKDKTKLMREVRTRC